MILRGGFALVWLGLCKRTGRKVAIKQMAKTGGGDSKRNDIYYGQLLFKDGGEPREEFKVYPGSFLMILLLNYEIGIRNISSFIDFKSTKSDDWHISELCGKTLSSLLFDIKGEFYKGERVYGVIFFLFLSNNFRLDIWDFIINLNRMVELLKYLLKKLQKL